MIVPLLAVVFSRGMAIAPVPVAPRAPVSAREGLSPEWAQFGFDAAHAGFNPDERRIDSTTVATLTRRFRVALPSVADGAPALSGGRLCLTLMDGTLVCLDAFTGALCWRTAPAPGPNYTTSSPAVDARGGLVYSYGLDGFVHRYRIGDGAETTGSGWPQLATLKPDVEKGSSALTLFTGRDGIRRLAAALGGYPGDAGDYQGHLTVIDLETGAQTVFNATCSSETVHFALESPPDCDQVQTAVWARAGAVFDAATDRLLFSTGNGLFDGSSGGDHWGDSVLAIGSSGAGRPSGPLDSYTPEIYQRLQDEDLDLGSSAPALLPEVGGLPRAMLQAGKDGVLRLLNADDLSGRGGPGHVGGELVSIPVPQGGEVLTAIATWRDGSGRSLAFVANGEGICAVELVPRDGRPALSPLWQASPGGSSPVVANGVVFCAAPGRIVARDAATGGELWSDTIGGVHWESPIVAGGYLYVADEAGMLSAYSVP